MKILILICMIFCHIVDDYYLQGWLATAKQKQWWKDNYPYSKYKHDYIMALFMHSFSWTFMITLPCHVAGVLSGADVVVLPLVFILNIMAHMFIDDLKANKLKINLIQDQVMHLIQIIITWFCYTGGE